MGAEMCYGGAMKQLLLAAALAAAALPASAQVFVNTEGNAHSCYMSTKAGNTGSLSAVRTCTEALSDPLTRADKAATHVNRGVLLMRRGESDKAVLDYERALELSPELTEAYINYSAALYYERRDDEALAAINTALELGTDKEAEALFNRALIYDRKEDARRAYYDLKRALELKPGWDIAEDAISRYTVRRASS